MIELKNLKDQTILVNTDNITTISELDALHTSIQFVGGAEVAVKGHISVVKTNFIPSSVAKATAKPLLTESAVTESKPELKKPVVAPATTPVVAPVVPVAPAAKVDDKKV